MLRIHHIELATANAFVTALHRHHGGVVSHRFSIGCFDGDKLVGVAICGRPKARAIDQYNAIEVTRLCTDGTHNACSILYAACRRAARELGYDRIITYILNTEPGTSLNAAGWSFEYETRGGSWNCESRPRKDTAPVCPKKLYACALQGGNQNGHS